MSKHNDDLLVYKEMSKRNDDLLGTIDALITADTLMSQCITDTTVCPVAEEDNVSEIMENYSHEARMERLMATVRHADSVKYQALEEMKQIINEMGGY